MGQATEQGLAPFRIHRYPAALIDRVMLADGRYALVRPVLPQDDALQQRFVRELSPTSRYRRFHSALSELSDAALAYLTQVDYRWHLALLAETFDDDGNERQVAEARYVRRSEPGEMHVADFAIAVADGWQGQGLGARLLTVLADSALRAGLQRLEGSVMADNEPMRALISGRGGRLRADPDDARLLVATLELAPPARPC
jgi:acetyltransferase